MGEDPGCSSGKLSPMWQEKSEILMQSLLEMNQGPWGKSPWPMLCEEPRATWQTSQIRAIHHWIKHRWASCKRERVGRVIFAYSRAILGQQRRNQALAWVTHANTLWDLGRHPLLLWASVSSSPQMRKCYNDVRKRLLPLPTPWEILIVIISCSLERTATLKRSGGNSAPKKSQILKEVWGVLGLFQHCFHLKWLSA